MNDDYFCEGGQGRSSESVSEDGKICGVITLAMVLMIAGLLALKLVGC